MDKEEWKNIELNEKQKRLSEEILKEAKKSMEESKPLEGLTEYEFGKRLAKIFKLRNLRNNIIGEEGYIERCKEINEEIEKELSFLKKSGFPYHPAFGNKEDWKAA